MNTKKINKLEEIKLSNLDMLNIYGGAQDEQTEDSLLDDGCGLKINLSKKCKRWADCKTICTPNWSSCP